MRKIVASICGCMVVAGMGFSAAAQSPKGAAVATAQGAMDAEEALAKAIQENNAEAIQSYMAEGWAVVSGRGGLGEGNSVFPDGIKSGTLTRKTFEISDPRIRMYGKMVLITTKVATSGVFAGKPFDVQERQTDVWIWMDGRWMCVLTHEAMMPKKNEK